MSLRRRASGATPPRRARMVGGAVGRSHDDVSSWDTAGGVRRELGRRTSLHRRRVAPVGGAPDGWFWCPRRVSSPGCSGAARFAGTHYKPAHCCCDNATLRLAGVKRSPAFLTTPRSAPEN
jgi:hypothetical protein